MSEWPTIELGQLAEFRNGLNYSAADNGTGLAVVGVSDFQDKSFVDYSDLAELDPSALSTPDALIRKNDIIFVRSNGNRELIGRSLLVLTDPPKPTSHSGFTIRLRFTDRQADPRFFAYFLRGATIRRHLSSQGGGTSINNLNQGILSRLTVPLPSLEIQRRVASILGAYDDLIEVNRRRIAVLEEMARGLFEEFAREAKERSLLFDVAEVSYGKNLPKSQLVEHGPHPVYGASKIIGHYSNYTHQKRTILLGCRGTVGEFQISQPNSFITNNSFSIEPNDDVDFPWLFFALKKRGVADTVSGSAQPQITLQGASKVEVLYPSADQRASFHSAVFPMLELSWGLSNANDKLTASRDLLLPRLISGQLSVAEAQCQLEEAA